MSCNKIEALLLRSLDRRLDDSAQAGLDTHLNVCPQCRKKKKEYEFIIEALGQEKKPDTKPYFWERLRPKLKEKRKNEAWTVWKQACFKAIPLSLLVVIVLAAATVFFTPAPNEEFDLSQTGNFLLQNTNPLQETQPFLTEEGGVNKHLMLIFSSLDETEGIRRYLP
jgi:hypothetical protein